MERRIHEDCGVAMIRLLKSQDYFKNKYGSWKYTLYNFINSLFITHIKNIYGEENT